ncbi:MAG: ATP-binding cassette domain-containing protein, partial [Geminicoccaceae bacterium]
MAMADVIASVGCRPTPGAAILSVSDLQVCFRTPHGLVQAVNGISFAVRGGETVGILGESGSGKSVSAGAVMGLLECPPAQIAGDIRFRGIDLLRASEFEARRIRGERIAMVHQDAVAALNPGLTVGYQIGEMFRVHRPGTSRREALREAVNLMDRVRIPSARQRVRSYPHEFSGGMSQRIMIAIAIALEPD